MWRVPGQANAQAKPYRTGKPDGRMKNEEICVQPFTFFISAHRGIPGLKFQYYPGLNPTDPRETMLQPFCSGCEFGRLENQPPFLLLRLSSVPSR
jgi:hypothetical protein